jgi:hypothetical protein
VKQKNTLKRLVGITGALALMISLSIPAFARSNTPQLKLFPKDVTAMLKETGETARTMENNLRDVIGTFESQATLFTESSCDAGSQDPGCVQLSEQIAKSYQKMLDIMQDSLPQMKRTISATNNGLASRLRSQLGKNSTPAQLQDYLGPESQPEVVNRSSRFSLSKRFAQYYSLISSTQQPLATLAAEIYLDTASVSEWIDLMEAEIGRQQTIIELGRMYGSVTPEMVKTVDNVKNIVFGEEDARGTVPAGPVSESTEFQSNLEY